MKNKFPGTCSCGIRIEAGEGEAMRNEEGRWVVRHADCAQTEGLLNDRGKQVHGATGRFYNDGEPLPREITDNSREAVYGFNRGIADRAARGEYEDIRGTHKLPTVASTYTLLSGHPASDKQAVIFDDFRYGRGSRIIKAVAGAGKTTTIKNAVRYLPEWAHVQLFAFNTEAAGQLKAAIVELEALGERSYRNVRAGTFHSVGFLAVMRKLGMAKELIRMDDNKCRDILRQRYTDNARTDEEREAGQRFLQMYGSFACDLVGFAKGEGIGALLPDEPISWWNLVEHHGLYLDSEEADPARGIQLARDLLQWSNDEAFNGWLDFDDQLYLVVLWKLRLWQNHVVVCDEAQDTNPVRRAMLKLALKPGGRLYAVGDPKQSIYGFTGASTDAMDLLAQEFNTQELPLTVSYRCARAVVERAQTWVPYIESHDAAPDGEVLDEVPLHAVLAQLTDQDAILCRQTAPLVTVAYGMIARGRPCRIMGREIGEGLVNLIENQKARGIEALIDKLEVWRDREMARFIAKGDERRAEAVADRVGCLMVVIDALPETERTVPGLVQRIRSLFDDRKDAGVLTLATVHKAKGQEWQQVAILRPELMPSRSARQEWQYEQEMNLQYVAATRAKERLLYVQVEDMKIDPPKREAA